MTFTFDIFDIYIWHLYLTSISDIYIWHLYLTFISDIYIWHLYLTCICFGVLCYFCFKDLDAISRRPWNSTSKFLLLDPKQHFCLRCFLRKSVSTYFLRKSVSNEKTICFTVANFFLHQKHDLNSKNCSENVRIWAILAAPVAANSGKKTCAFSM